MCKRQAGIKTKGFYTAGARTHNIPHYKGQVKGRGCRDRPPNWFSRALLFFVMLQPRDKMHNRGQATRPAFQGYVTEACRGGHGRALGHGSAHDKQILTLLIQEPRRIKGKLEGMSCSAMTTVFLSDCPMNCTELNTGSMDTKHTPKRNLSQMTYIRHRQDGKLQQMPKKMYMCNRG